MLTHWSCVFLPLTHRYMIMFYFHFFIEMAGHRARFHPHSDVQRASRNGVIGGNKADLYLHSVTAVLNNGLGMAGFLGNISLTHWSMRACNGIENLYWESYFRCCTLSLWVLTCCDDCKISHIWTIGYQYVSNWKKLDPWHYRIGSYYWTSRTLRNLWILIIDTIALHYTTGQYTRLGATRRYTYRIHDNIWNW